MAIRKPRCNFKECKEAAQRIVGDCSFCSGHFCSKHRMLEAHSCTGLEDCKKESHARNADKLNNERTQVIKGVDRFRLASRLPVAIGFTPFGISVVLDLIAGMEVVFYLST
ncbi:hypothetical protein P168DRAFT_314948 [Aspergillus campestris IBT 28561]|nr:uncharacterized protein P168DRAFT_314948 [Aspergillus campestris IBT 28561]PKY08905.1 hypothetical protein P168DRAFT_314948 [Aspergillus campestris IBT 28561]